MVKYTRGGLVVKGPAFLEKSLGWILSWVGPFLLSNDQRDFLINLAL